MTATKAWQEYWKQYQRAVQADECFKRAVVQQFGARKAGDMRYQSSAFNHDTGMAALAKRWADDDMKSALDIARAFPVLRGVSR